MRSFQNLSQNEVRDFILRTEVDKVLGRDGGCSDWFWGNAMSKEGLEQFPNEDRDRDPLWDTVIFGRGEMGEEEEDELALSTEARLIG